MLLKAKENHIEGLKKKLPDLSEEKIKAMVNTVDRMKREGKNDRQILRALKNSFNFRVTK